MEDGAVLIGAVDLLASSTDADGDTLAIRNLQLADGRGVLRQMSDTTWEFQPLKDWSGDVALNYEVSDGLWPGVPPAAHSPSIHVLTLR